MKFGQLLEYNNRNVFFKNHAENEARRIFPDFFFLFFKKKKTLYEVIASFFSLVSIFFDSPQFDIQ